MRGRQALERRPCEQVALEQADAAIGKLKFGAGCGPDERIIKIPRKTLVLAKSDIPESI